MTTKLQILQLNVGKREGVQLSLLNDKDLENYTVLAIQEPTALRINNNIKTTPMMHKGWIKMIPTEQREGRWAFRSMLWVNAYTEAIQIPVPSPDITAALIRFPDRQILVTSVYIEPGNSDLRTRTVELLRKLYNDTQTGERVEALFVGDFNMHDQLWGGDSISDARQGEGDELVDLMGELGLISLLPRGTKTWQNHRSESTIDLALATEELSRDLITCKIHPTEHGSDHRAIETTFNIETPAQTTEPRLLLKNAPWKDIRTRVEENLRFAPVGGTVQSQADRLEKAVAEAVNALTPRARPSPYAKRWWTSDLTKLRKTYTYHRNRARSHRRAGSPDQNLERTAKEASKEYHDAIRKRKKAHWEDFLADSTNIWQAARYMQPANLTSFDKVPPLSRADGSRTEDTTEQAQELMKTFFPPLPEEIEDEGQRPNRASIPLPPLTLEEVERQVLRAKPWKAPGEDGLPAAVWKEVWQVVKTRVLHLFRQSLDTGDIPHQWKQAKIIPLKKPNKGDYTKAKAWRPISLLSTLGKLLEAVVAERISNLVETFGLLPTNHFGARKQRSAEQALVLLQEQIYNAWRSRKVLSLISFDVKGAYNGVYKERLIQRLLARGVPPTLTRWVDSFCSDRTATIVVNGQASDNLVLPQAGLPQGSPLSPILFLFFNADLVQQKITKLGGSMAFVDDFTAWVTANSVAENRPKIENLIGQTIGWERRSGATLEGEKTVIVHFTRNPQKDDNSPFMVKGQQVIPQQSAKILGVVMDSRLRFKEHIANAATKGLNAALALKRLRGLPPSVSRQLFTAVVTPRVDYASTVWAHACTSTERKALDRVQKIGAQAITGAFKTVATTVAEAEANIATTQSRHSKQALKMWIKIQTLPPSHPLAKLNTRAFQRFISPLQRIARNYSNIPAEKMETITPFALAPWEPRLQAPGHSRGRQRQIERQAEL